MSEPKPNLRLVAAAAPADPGTKTEEAQAVTVDPGQVIRINARFPDSPTRVAFSFLAPSSRRPVHDPGHEAISTKLERNGDVFSYFIDTAGMPGGEGWWYFYSQDDDRSKRRAKVGRFYVREVPAVLVEQNLPPAPEPTAAALEATDDGLDLLGADDASAPSEAKVLIGVGVAIGIGLLATV